jgi:RHS repeat-associated protein
VLTRITTEEGRVAPDEQDPDTWRYYYNLTDHLGNVRVTITDPTAIEYLATLEDADSTREKAEFGNSYRTETIQTNSADTSPDNKAQLLRGYAAAGDEVVGLTKSLAVYPGDKVDMQVYANFTGVNTTNPAEAVNFGLMFLQAFGIPTSGEGGMNPADFDGFSQATAPTTTQYPINAYLNYVYFDKDFELLDMGFFRVPGTAQNNPTIIEHTLDITEEGYVMIYLTNEETELTEVYFNDFQVTHTPTVIAQTDSYYPGGLTFNSYQRVTATPNDYLYQGKEFEEETGTYDFTFRTYDPALIRTWQVDPRADKFYEYSPYSWALGNPISIIDPTGMVAFPGDFYGENGKKLGTDGIEDGKVYVVTDKKEAKSIAKTDKSGGTTQVSDVNSAVELPSADVREQMGEAVARSNAPNESVGDTEGGFHEEGGMYGKTNGQDKVIDAQPGAAADPSKVDHAEVNPYSGETADNYLEEVEGTFHVHPKGEVKVSRGSNTIGGDKTYSFDQSPSPPDYKAAGSVGESGNHYVLGAKGTVTIYKASGIIATFPLEEFRTIGIRKK